MEMYSECTNFFCNHCQFEKNLCQKTLKAYKQDLGQFMSFLEQQGHSLKVALLNKDIIRAYLQALMGKYKIKTVKRKIASLKSFLNYLELEEVISVNPFRRLKIALKAPQLLPKIISIDEVNNMFKSAYNGLEELRGKSSFARAASVRNIAVLELLFETGMRVSEICGLKRSDIDIGTGTIKVVGKGRKERILQICSKACVNILLEYMNAINRKTAECNQLFINRLGRPLSDQSIRLMIKKYAHAADLNKNVTPHMFRHTFATLLLEENVDIRYIQYFLGHSSITTTEIYTHVSNRKAKELIMTKHPRSHLGCKGII